MTVNWNPWHGCTKTSAGCLHCYMFRSDTAHGRNPEDIRKTADFNLPVRKNRNGEWKVPSGSLVWTCFTSDFLHERADVWRDEAWQMIRQRPDLYFFFITKRIDRFLHCIPADWHTGWDNVEIGCTMENQDRAQYRMPYFLQAPIRRRTIICEPLLEPIDFSRWLAPDAIPPAENAPAYPGNTARPTAAADRAGAIHTGNRPTTGNTANPESAASPRALISRIVAGGESGTDARLCKYEWIYALYSQCKAAGIGFHFKQTGAHFEKDGKRYTIPRKLQHVQAYKAGLNFKSQSLTKPLNWQPPYVSTGIGHIQPEQPELFDNGAYPQ